MRDQGRTSCSDSWRCLGTPSSTQRLWSSRCHQCQSLSLDLLVFRSSPVHQPGPFRTERVVLVRRCHHWVTIVREENRVTRAAAAISALQAVHSRGRRRASDAVDHGLGDELELDQGDAGEHKERLALEDGSICMSVC